MSLVINPTKTSIKLELRILEHGDCFQLEEGQSIFRVVKNRSDELENADQIPEQVSWVQSGKTLVYNFHNGFVHEMNLSQMVMRRKCTLTVKE